MRIQDIIEGKKEWRAHMARVKALPQDYQIVYKEIQKYLFKVGPVELTDGTGLLESYTLNLNGRTFVTDTGVHFQHGDTLLLFSSQAGG